MKSLQVICFEYGNDHGVEVRVCVHGSGTNSIPVKKKQ